MTQEVVDKLYEAMIRIYTNDIIDTDIVTNNDNQDLTPVPAAQVKILDGDGTLNSLTNFVSSIDFASTFNTLSGIFGFITANFDVVTALALVKHLENRAMYDPR